MLVLDEPTNDLDIETLELLEEQLLEWSGTLLLVTHDRVFMDHVVTTTCAFEGQGTVREYVGGYADWERQRHQSVPPTAARKDSEPRTKSTQSPAIGGGRKLSYKEQQELLALPGRIEAMERELEVLNAKVTSADFYKETADSIHTSLARVETLQQEILDAYARWDELDARG